MTHHVIYIFGLGDHRARGQELAVKLWRFYGVESEVMHMHWHDGKAFEPKLSELIKRIDDYIAAGDRVSLVAASAGASVAINAYAQRKDQLSGIVLICGKINNPESMHPSVFEKNVSFKQSMAMVPESLQHLTAADRARIMTVHPLADESVPIPDTYIEEAVERTVPVFGHAFGIGYSITIYAPFIMKFLKRQANLSTK